MKNRKKPKYKNYGDSYKKKTARYSDDEEDNYTSNKRTRSQTVDKNEKRPTNHKEERPYVDPDVHRLAVKADHLMRVSNKQYIYRFDPTELNTKIDGKRAVFVGSTGAGKTQLLNYLLQFMHHLIPSWAIVNPSEPGNHAYGSHVPTPGIIHDSDDIKSIVETCIRFKARQISRCNKWLIPGTDPKEYIQDPSACLILDDICSDLKLFNDPIFGWLYNNSRNFKTLLIVLIQYLYMLPKKYRKQISHIFFFGVDSIKDIKTIHEDFGGVVENFAEFKRIFLKATDKRGCLVIKVNERTLKIEEKMFWYSIEGGTEAFTLGADWFKEQAKERYNKEWENKKTVEAQQRIEELTGGKRKGGQKQEGTKNKKQKNDVQLDIELVGGKGEEDVVLETKKSKL